MSTPVLILISSLTGLLIGLVAGRFIDPIRKGDWQKSANYQKAQEELEIMRAQVDEHFIQTSQILSDLQSRLISESARITGLNLEVSDQDTANLTRLVGESTEPPRDYAPKADDSVGTLSEEYGLKDDDYEPKTA